MLCLKVCLNRHLDQFVVASRRLGGLSFPVPPAGPILQPFERASTPRLAPRRCLLFAEVAAAAPACTRSHTPNTRTFRHPPTCVRSCAQHVAMTGPSTPPPHRMHAHATPPPTSGGLPWKRRGLCQRFWARAAGHRQGPTQAR
jgi:hypothetical protein